MLEFLNSFIDYLSDKSILYMIQKLKSDYFILTSAMSYPVYWGLKKFVKWTPWKSDDNLPDVVFDKLNIKKPRKKRSEKNNEKT